MLDNYISDQNKSLIEKEEADTNLDKFQFRIQGSKTVEEIKKEVSIFLEKNNVPLEVEEELQQICDDFDENTDVYHASLYLENFMKQYLENKEKTHQENSDTVQEIKTDLVEEVKKDLDAVGVMVSDSDDTLVDSIQSEADVYKLKDNTEQVTEYLDERNQLLTREDKTLVELPIEQLTQVLEKPGDEALLQNVLVAEEKQVDNKDSQVEVKEDGSVVVEGNANHSESMNFVAMMTLALMVENNEFNFNQDMDMKFVKQEKEEANFQVTFGHFSPSIDEIHLEKDILPKVMELVNNYDSSTSYMDILGTYSPEIMLALKIVEEQELNQPGSFKLAIKNNGNRYDMKFGIDDRYQDLISAFCENGAYITEDINHDSIIIIPGNPNSDQLVLLNAVLETLMQKGYTNEEAQQLLNQYQKKLVFDNNAANVQETFLIVVLVTEMVLLFIGAYFLFR